MAGQLTLDGLGSPPVSDGRSSADRPPQGYHNLFFGIVPPKEIADLAVQIGAAQRDALDPAAHLRPARVMHTTLQPLLPRANRLPSASKVISTLSEISTAPFRISFNRATSFANRKGGFPRVLVCDEQGAEGGRALHRALIAEMRKLDLRISTSFKPHMTLFYGREVFADEPVYPIEWTVREFVLIDSVYGSTKHNTLARWALRD